MVDTIKIVLPIANPSMLHNQRFEPFEPRALVYSRGYGNTKLNLQKYYARNHNKYVPRLTLYKRATHTGSLVYELAVEFSAPKMLRGNNFEELTGSELGLLAEALQTSLDELLGHIFTTQEILNARVSAFHPSKNIVLPARVAARAVVGSIAKLDISMHYDLQRTDFKDGRIVHIHTNSMDIAFYDKGAELRAAHKSIKRSIEQEPVLHAKIHDALTLNNKHSVLRYEIRLNNSQKIKAAFPSLDAWNLQSLFKEDICQSFLQHHWKTISQSIDLLSLDIDKPYELFQKRQADEPDMPLKSNLASVGAMLIAAQVGVREFRSNVESHHDRSTWYRIRKQMSPPVTKRSSWVEEVDNSLRQFKPVQEQDLTDNSFNNLVGFGKLTIEDF